MYRVNYWGYSHAGTSLLLEYPVNWNESNNKESLDTPHFAISGNKYTRVHNVHSLSACFLKTEVDHSTSRTPYGLVRLNMNCAYFKLRWKYKPRNNYYCN